ncbi:MAG: beta-lactamase family protein [Acholeplasmatales bacterium]|nr:beta-lactamase family protein [Acholeplasmatales bacterium]
MGNNNERIFNEACKAAYEGVLYGEVNNESFDYQYGIDLDKKIALGGVTKLFTVACVLRLIENKKLILDSKLPIYLDEEKCKGLCNIKGIDHSKVISVRDLLYQTSGINDYFNDFVRPQISKNDVSYTFDDKIEWTKMLNGVNRPGKSAYYSNLNFDLLVFIIEKVTGKTIEEIYKEYIIGPLNLKSTYIAKEDSKYVPAIFYDGKPLRRNSLLVSSYGSGGLISTPRELMKFIRAFFNGWLFDENLIKKLTEFNPMENGLPNVLYGGGLMKIKSKRTILGQIGYTGAFAFADPDRKIYFVGYLSQDGCQPILAKMIQELFEKN